MYFQPHPFSVPFLLAALAAAGFAANIWPSRKAPGARTLLVHMLGLILWSGANAAMWLSSSRNAQLFWLEFSSVGIALVPATFLVFSLQVSHNENLLQRRLVYLLVIEPLIGLFLLWTNDHHHLVYNVSDLWIMNGLAELQWSPGFWISVDAVYMYVVYAAGIWFLARSLSRNGILHREQTRLILAGACLPIISETIYFIPLSGHFDNLDLSPVFFVFSGGLYFYAMARRKFADLIPVAHGLLFDSMEDGVLVLDMQDRIVEMNPAAGRFLQVNPGQLVGRRVMEALTNWEGLNQPFWEQPQTRMEIIVAQEIPCCLDLSITPLVDARKRYVGRVLVFRDITLLKKNETILKEVNAQLNKQLDEIRFLRDQLHEQAIRDPLTNLFNRRYLEEQLSKELARAKREFYPLSLILMDIDQFKRVNDTCGHRVGDESLQALANILVTRIRQFDVACRYGGEEFVIIMPRMTVEKAYERAETIRHEFWEIEIPNLDETVRPTLSFGVAAYPAHGNTIEDLLRSADVALYAAKSSGRNRGLIYAETASK